MAWMNPPNGSYNNMMCDNSTEYPVEHLFKAIHIMSPISELDKETERLKKKMHRFLMKSTKEVKGVRIYEGSIKYLPNGLCSWNRADILLEGYKSDYVPPEPEPVVEPEQEPITAETVAAAKKKARTQKKRKYPVEQVLRETFPIWYAQIKEHLKRKNYASPTFSFKEGYLKAEVYNKLNDKEKEMINNSHQLGNQISSASYNIFNLFADHHFQHVYHSTDKASETFTFLFLMEDEIEELLALCERGRNAYHEKKARTSWWYGSIWDVTEPLLQEFVKKLDKNRKGRNKIELTHMLNKQPEQYQTYQYRNYTQEEIQKYGRNGGTHEMVTKTRYVVGMNAIFTELPKELAKIKDETIIKILTNMGVYVADMIPEIEEEPETEEVVQEEPEMVIIEVGDKPFKKKHEENACIDVIDVEVVEVIG